jgi:tetratricopeptide (TPR) repeat protein
MALLVESISIATRGVFKVSGVNMTSLHQNPPPKFPPGMLLGIGIGLAAVGLFSTVQYVLEQQHYEQAMQAYKNADCNTAINQFDRVIDSARLLNIDSYVPRAKQKKAECEYFQRAVDRQQQGEFEAALSNYATLAKIYSDSALIEPARQRVAEMFQTAKLSALTTPNLCKQFDPVSKQDLVPNLIPKSDTIPQFYLACGKGYETTQQYQQAMALYRQFLDQHPTTQTQAMERGLARATVANWRKQGVQTTEPPAFVGMTADGSTVIDIQNSSPRRMQITFSGPTPKFEELEPCQDCRIYANRGPEACPEKGPIGRYKLEPGQYQVAVEFMEQPNEMIESAVGDWKLSEGSEYRKCHVIVNNLDRKAKDRNAKERKFSF